MIAVWTKYLHTTGWGFMFFRYRPRPFLDIFFSPNGIIFRSYNQIVHIVCIEVHGFYDIHLCEYCILLYYIFIDAFPSIYISYCIVRLWLYHFDPAFFPSIIYSFIHSSTIFSSSCHPFIWPALLFCRRRWTIIFWPCEYDLTSEKSVLPITQRTRTGLFIKEYLWMWSHASTFFTYWLACQQSD